MTDEEAKEIGSIISTADGGCHVCVADLAKLLKESFPQFDWNKLAGVADEDAIS